MKKILKKTFIVSAAAFCLLMTGCKQYDEILSSYVFEFNNAVVTTDFELPAYIKEKKVKWKSSNSNIVSINLVEEDNKEDNYYIAKITVPEQREEITLTVSLGSSEREFKVFLNPIDAFDIGYNYSFPYGNMKVSEGFDLDSSFTYKNRTANISWEVADEESSKYISIVDGTNGKKHVNVVESSIDPQVALKATFTFGNYDPYITKYKFNVTVNRTGKDAMDYYYEGGNTADVTGYIIGVGENPTASNGYATFYLVDEQGYGRYIYRTALSVEDKEKLKTGAKVKITDLQSVYYSGVIESVEGTGNVEFLYDGNNQIIDTSKVAPYDLNNELLNNLPSTKYHTGQMVTVKGFKVTQISKQTEYDNKTCLKLVNGDINFEVRFSKAMKGWYGTKNAQAFQDINAKLDTIKVGDYVDVTGILTRYFYEGLPQANNDGFQIYAYGGESIVKSTVQALGSGEDGALVKAAQDALDAKLKEAKVMKDNGASRILTDAATTTTIVLPNKFATNGTISYVQNYNSSSVSIEEGTDSTTIKVQPQEGRENVHICASYTLNGVTYDKFFYIHSVDVDDATQVALEKENLNITSCSGDSTYSFTPKFYDDVTIGFAPFEGYENDYEISADGSHITFYPVDARKTVKYKVVVSKGSEVETLNKQTTVKVTERKIFSYATDLNTEDDYTLGFKTPSAIYYFDGGLTSNGFYGTTTTMVADAATVTLEAVNEKPDTYYIKLGSNYIGLTYSAEHTTFTLSSTTKTEWQMINGALVASNEGVPQWMGARASETYYTIGGNSNDNYAYETNYPCTLNPKYVDDTRTVAERLAFEKEALNINNGESVRKNKEYALSDVGPTYNDVHIAYELKNAATDAEYATIADNKLTILKEDYTEKEIIVTATLRCGSNVTTKDITLTVDPYTVYADDLGVVLAEALKVADGETVLGYFKVSGFISEIDQGNIYISIDGSKTNQYLLSEYNNSDLSVGDYIYIRCCAKRSGSGMILLDTSLLETHELLSIEEFCEGLTTSFSKNPAMVGGYVVEIGDWNSEYQSTKYVITDGVHYLTINSCPTFAEGVIKVGDYICFYGYGKDYGNYFGMGYTKETNPEGLTAPIHSDEFVAAYTFIDALDDLDEVNYVNLSGIELDQPTEVEGLTPSVVYTLKDSTATALSIVNNKLVVSEVPDELTEYIIVATVTCGDIEIVKEIKVGLYEANHKCVNETLAKFTNIKVKEAGDVLLPTRTEIAGIMPTIDYTLVKGKGIAVQDENLPNKITISTVTTTEVKLTVKINVITNTLTNTEEKTITISVKEPVFDLIATYNFAGTSTADSTNSLTTSNVIESLNSFNVDKSATRLDMFTEALVCNKVYTGNTTADGMKFGTTSVNGELKVKLAQPVIKIVVKMSNFYSDSVSINGSTKEALGSTIVERTFEFEEATDELEFLFFHRGHIQSIEFYGEK